MGVWTAPGYCPHCREEVMAACAASTDRLHLVLTLLTGGLWGFVWIYCRFHARVCICCQCGRRLTRSRLHTMPLPAGGFWPLESFKPSNPEFNSLLVARNLVYYVPTNARFRRV
jgi:hypothetical protein